jgi:hypothetical protein
LKKWLSRFILGLRPTFGLWPYLLFHVKSLGRGVNNPFILKFQYLLFGGDKRQARRLRICDQLAAILRGC